MSSSNQQTNPIGDIEPKKFKVYRICSKDKNEERCRWGYTSEQWEGPRGGNPRRIQTHQNCTKNPKNNSYGYYIYQIIRETGGWSTKETSEGKWTYELINSFDTKEEALALENEMHERDENCCCGLPTCQGYGKKL